MIERDGDTIRVNDQVIRLPHYRALENPDDGTWYINEYVKDADGTMRRDTIADGLTEEEATVVTREILNHFAENHGRRRPCHRPS